MANIDAEINDSGYSLRISSSCTTFAAVSQTERKTEMAAKTALKILTDYFNVGDGKRPTREWAQEIRDLSSDERKELTDGVMAITGDTLVTSK